MKYGGAQNNLIVKGSERLPRE